MAGNKSSTAARTEEYDVVVVGGAAAGLSGALALVRARRSVAVVDAGDPRNAPAAHVHNYLGREGTAPGSSTRPAALKWPVTAAPSWRARCPP
ncbi:FAD-binding protein [Arthrobacter sp. ATA002]|uniref:FAD-binding protein n=1 Tax=Arthrobacter sp. ATA002 TaxID=2991715 RepID=UPI002E31E977|nr:FAD-binding protein [Arthrobacter sp. ATA002]